MYSKGVGDDIPAASRQDFDPCSLNFFFPSKSPPLCCWLNSHRVAPFSFSTLSLPSFCLPAVHQPRATMLITPQLLFSSLLPASLWFCHPHCYGCVCCQYFAGVYSRSWKEEGGAHWCLVQQQMAFYMVWLTQIRGLVVALRRWRFPEKQVAPSLQTEHERVSNFPFAVFTIFGAGSLEG